MMGDMSEFQITLCNKKSLCSINLYLRTGRGNDFTITSKVNLFKKITNGSFIAFKKLIWIIPHWHSTSQWAHGRQLNDETYLLCIREGTHWMSVNSQFNIIHGKMFFFKDWKKIGNSCNHFTQKDHQIVLPLHNQHNGHHSNKCDY